MTPTKTPLDAGFIARVVSGVRYMVTGAGPDAWFGPGNPLPPVAQDKAAGRAFDYPTTLNLKLQPRADEAVSFSQLRALADNYGLLRLVIETRKDQLSALEWVVVPVDKAAKPDERCAAIAEFLRFPDKEHNWDEWLRMLAEEMLVTDATSIYPLKTMGDKPYAFEPIDGTTVKRVLDVTGRTPIPPDVAYQQVLKGMPAVDYTRDELIYKPRNVRTHKVYGFSRVEQIITTVNIAIRRELYQLQYFTEGSTPDLIMQVPETWNVDQTKQFSEYWQSLLAGNTAQRAKTMFVPGGVKPVDTKDKALHDMFDEWIARIVCYAFGVSPQALVKGNNKSTSEVSVNSSKEEGLHPDMKWIEGLMDYIIAKYFNAPDLRFMWSSPKEKNPLIEAQIAQIYVESKVITPDEARADLGKEPLTPEQKEELAPPIPTAFPPALPSDGGEGKPNPLVSVAKAQKKSPYNQLTAVVRP